MFTMTISFITMTSLIIIISPIIIIGVVGFITTYANNAYHH